VLKFGGAVVLTLAGLAALFPLQLAWAYLAPVLVFELWLLRRIAAAGDGLPPIGEPPYHFSAEEAELVGRYRFYFTWPALARESGAILAAIGLSALVLSPWLLYRGQLIPAALVALNVLAVGALTKRLAPLLMLRMGASKGDRAALRMLELHDPLWEKIKAANATGG